MKKVKTAREGGQIELICEISAPNPMNIDMTINIHDGKALVKNGQIIGRENASIPGCATPGYRSVLIKHVAFDRGSPKSSSWIV